MNANDAFPGKFLKAADLQGRRVRVEISNVEIGKVGENRKIIITFRGKERQMVCNKTNMNTLVQLTGSSETDDWIGWVVTLYAGHTTYQGQTVSALRISDDPGSANGPRRQQARQAPRRDDREEFSSDDRGGYDRDRERFREQPRTAPQQQQLPPDPPDEPPPPDDRQRGDSYRSGGRVYDDDIPF